MGRDSPEDATDDRAAAEATDGDEEPTGSETPWPNRVKDADGGDDSDPITRKVVPYVVERPWTVLLAFFLVTAVMVAGIGGGGQADAGADEFTDDLDEMEAFEDMEEDFDRQTRDTGGTTAQLFVSDDSNILDRDGLLRMLEFQESIEDDDSLRVASSSSPATTIAEHLHAQDGDGDDDGANTDDIDPDEGTTLIEGATDRELAAAIEETAESLSVDADFTPESGQADVAMLAVTYDTPPNADESDHAPLQYGTVDAAEEVDGYEPGENVIVSATAITNDEVNQLLIDTSIIVFPAAVVLILFFLLVAYRDPIDLGLGLSALLMTMLWTFGFMGHANIPFSQSLVTVFPLLLAVGIDFGIHIINRYREERVAGGSIGDAMGITTRQLSAAFLIVTVTTVFSFAANLTSDIGELRDFGVVAGAGIVFTFLIFGVYLPAGKVALDRLRQGTRIPQIGSQPMGREGSALGRLLSVGATIARIAPVLVLVTGLVVGAGAGAYGTGVDTEFSEEAFFPEQERIDDFQAFPEPLAPADYTFMAALDHMEEDFEMPFEDTSTVYVDDNALREDDSLADIDDALADPPDAFESEDRRADAESLISVMETRAETDPEFAELVDRYDETGDGVPDREVDRVLEELLEDDDALGYLTTDRSSTRIDYTVDVDADDDEAIAATQEIADGMSLDATATGNLVVFGVVIEQITDSSINSLFIAFALTAVFLTLSYRWLEGRAVYGLINLVPVVVTVSLLAGSMRFFDIPLTPINAPILAVSIGLGVDYTVHFMHRFVDEYERRAATNDRTSERKRVDDALAVTVRGTGGALTGSMFTTVTGLGVLYLALIPLIAEFGLVLALGVFYAYATSIVLLPSTIVVWARLDERYGGTLAAAVGNLRASVADSRT